MNTMGLSFIVIKALKFDNEYYCIKDNEIASEIVHYSFISGNKIETIQFRKSFFFF